MLFRENYTNKKTQKTTALHSFEGEKLIIMLFLTAHTGEQGGAQTHAKADTR